MSTIPAPAPARTLATRAVAARRVRSDGSEDVQDEVACEVPVAITYNGLPHAVMMATPENLEDFALGFSFSETIITNRAEIFGTDIVQEPAGLQLRITLAAAAFTRFRGRRRGIVGRTGCGLCGIESLADLPQPAALGGTLRLPSETIARAVAALPARQVINLKTGGCHAAAFATADGDIIATREDVGRHNALDKLIGAMLGGSIAASPGLAVLSSRASFEMVDKAARAGFEVLASVSAPTALAVERAEAQGLTLIAFARNGRFTIYSRPERIVL